jgi:potassium efflux system protein
MYPPSPLFLLHRWARPTGVGALFLVLCFAALAIKAAPPIPGGQSETAVSQEELEAKIKEVEAMGDEDAVLKDKLVELYRSAVRFLEASHSHEAAAAAFTEAIESAPREAQRLRRRLEEASNAPVTPEYLQLGEDTPLSELEQRLVKENADLSALEAKLADLEKQLQEQQRRPNVARERLTKLKQNQEEISRQLDAPAAPEEPTSLTEARTLALQLQRKAQSDEIHMLDQELLSYGPRLDLLKVTRDWTARSVSRVGERVRVLEELLNQHRRAQVEQVKAHAMEAELEAKGKHPAIQKLAGSNADLSRKLADLAADLERVNAERDTTERQTRQLEQDFKSTQNKLEIAGLSEAAAYVLIDQRRRLPAVAQYRKAAAARKEEIAKSGLMQVRVDEERRNLGDLDLAADQILTDELVAGLPAGQQAGLRKEIAQLLHDRRALLDESSTTIATYVRALSDLDFAQRQLLDVVDRYGAFLDEHLLWVPNAPPVGNQTTRNLALSLVWILSPAHWIDTLGTLGSEAVRQPFLFIAALVLFGIFLLAHRRLRAKLDSIANEVQRFTTDRFALTLQALGITVLLAIPWPMLMAVPGMALQSSLEASTFAKTVGTGLILCAPILLNVLGIYLLCTPRGVAEVHFRWREHTLTLLRRNLYWLTAIGLPSAFVAAFAGRFPEEVYRNSLSRLAFIVIMVALAIFLWRILNPKSGITRAPLREQPEGWLARTRLVWYPAAIGAPIALAALAMLGYYYTAGQLARNFVDTLWLWWGAVLVHDLVVRWLVITQRRLTIQMIRERREAACAARTAKEAGGMQGEDAPQVAEEGVDLVAIDAQTRRLLQILLGWSIIIGIYLIWEEVIPAFGILEDISVWHQSISVEGQERIVPITLADLLLGLVLVAMVAAAARNVPGVLEIAFLRRTSVKPGSRYAITTLARYAIVAMGVVLVFNTIGGSWSSIQWLVAALSVGLGFGLQEIFGNFISGLILLFERPVRVADTVTVGDLTGKITRIRIRATTITDWDRKEIVVPNKNFITERVVNWTLSDPITRIVIPVGVAYGSDTTLTHKVILDTIRANPMVLSEPEPRVFFVGLGESSLNFNVYVFVNELANRLPLTHEVLMAIERALREHGIQIPFPQRDIHVRSIPQAWTPGDIASSAGESNGTRRLEDTLATRGKETAASAVAGRER